jgi:UDP-N-acetylmuramate dehydrogenase
VLVRDEGFDGLVIRYMARTWEIAEAQDGGLLYAEAGVPIGRMVWMVGARGWSNMEWAAGLPGSVGGALYGNAGCYGGDVASILRRAWVLVEDEVQEWSASHMGFGYRSSILKAQDSPYTSMLTAGRGQDFTQRRKDAKVRAGDGGLPTVSPRLAVLLAGEFQLARAEQATLVERMKQVVSLRKAKTPVGSSCGSVFKNPSSLPQSAGQLIDAAGLKGTRIGAAEISQMHANYIVNLGGASADDVLRLIELARSQVLRQFGVELELEIQVSGGAV